MRLLVICCLLPLLLIDRAHGQSDHTASAWGFYAELNTYCYPSEDVTLLPIVVADRGHLHIEGRYNYEDERTASLFAGWIFAWEGSLSGDITPMLGLVLGNTNGIAPGLEVSAALAPIDFYTEWEYVFAFEDAQSSFFYSWTELAVNPADWLRVGLVGQSTRVVDTGRDVQRGFLLGGSYGDFGLTFHLFNPDDAVPYYVFTLEASFE